jgi:hypothetical protein
MRSLRQFLAASIARCVNCSLRQLLAQANRDAIAQSIAQSIARCVNCSLSNNCPLSNNCLPRQIKMRSLRQLLAQANRDALAQSIARWVNCALGQLRAGSIAR